MTDASLFLVSTPLHLMVSLAIVEKENLENAHLLFIDQVTGRQNPYLEVLQAWQTSPFRSIDVFYRPPQTALAKRRARKQTFARLQKQLEQLQPQHIYCGNDRRVEFQYCMHAARRLGCQPVGYYMDEGAFTYVGREASKSMSDRIVDNWLKKLVYGFWYKHPPTVGASAWVDTAYLSFPQLAHPLLQQKNSRQLTLDYWQGEKLKNFCSLLLDKIGKPEKLADYDAFFTLPHESIIQANAEYQATVKRMITERLASGQIIGIKYHPRDAEPDALQLAELEGVEIAARAIPFEALLPLFNNRLEVIGDFSTTLITTRLLRPDLSVTAMDHGQGRQSDMFAGLYQKLGIGVVNVSC